jgi:hypothetical protein
MIISVIDMAVKMIGQYGSMSATSALRSGL